MRHCPNVKCVCVNKKGAEPDSQNVEGCPNTAELLPVLELRPNWNTPPIMCAISKLATCAAHHVTVDLMTVLMNVDAEGIATSLERAGHKKPLPQYTTLAWKPIPPEFEPNSGQMLNPKKIVKPSLILPN